MITFKVLGEDDIVQPTDFISGWLFDTRNDGQFKLQPAFITPYRFGSRATTHWYRVRDVWGPDEIGSKLGDVISANEDMLVQVVRRFKDGVPYPLAPNLGALGFPLMAYNDCDMITTEQMDELERELVPRCFWIAKAVDDGSQDSK